ncbi:MAG: hypothetical protein ABIN79_04575 [Marmoricola sp.]
MLPAVPPAVLRGMLRGIPGMLLVGSDALSVGSVLSVMRHPR